MASSNVIAYQTTFIPVMHQPCIKGIEEYMYESDSVYAKEKGMRDVVVKQTPQGKWRRDYRLPWRALFSRS